MFNKTLMPFYIIAGMFLIMVGYLGSIYFYEPNGELSKDASLEINLPVIQLDEYLNLSKSLE